ncbi:MAG: sugar phosphate isomerase/epimerase [Candidatus Aminicenantes bacterium]|nr:sugar phosphate isomerase/epimerase [Candidatus Aminicenantes bacterium]
MTKTKRRDFLKYAALGLGTPPFIHLKNSRSNRQSSPKTQALILGMASYTFREFSLEDTISMTKRLGLKRIALKSFHLPLESTLDEIKAAASKVREAGLDLYACGVVYMNNPDEVSRAFDYAKTAGMTMIIGVPKPELLKLVEQKVQASGIKVAIHNHGPEDKLYPTPGHAYDLIRNLDNDIGLCLDIGHAQRSAVDPAWVAEKYADRLLDIHIKDVTAAAQSGTTIEIGRGMINIPNFLKTLIKIGYQGTAALEFEKDSKDPLPGSAESIGYLRGVLDTIQ